MFYRMRNIVPRFYQHARQLEACPRRNLCRKPERDVPMFSPWGRGFRSPWNRLIPFVLKEFDSHFREMARDMDRMVSSKNFDGYRGFRRHFGEGLKSEVAEVRCDNKVFEVKLDVRHYEPENLNVKIIENRLIISGKHEQKADDHGFVSREFNREFLIPENVDPETICSSLSDEGILLVQGKVKGFEEAPERVINIERNGTSAADARSCDSTDSRSRDSTDSRSRDSTDSRSRDSTDSRSRDSADARSRDSADARSRDSADVRSRDSADARCRDSADSRSRDGTDLRYHDSTGRDS